MWSCGMFKLIKIRDVAAFWWTFAICFGLWNLELGIWNWKLQLRDGSGVRYIWGWGWKEPGEHQGWVVALEVSWCWGGARGTQSGWWLTRLSFWGRISNWSEKDTSWWETLLLMRWIIMGKKYNWFQRDAYCKKMTKRFQDKTHHVFGKYVSKPLISLSFSTHSQDEIGPV